MDRASRGTSQTHTRFSAVDVDGDDSISMLELARAMQKEFWIANLINGGVSRGSPVMSFWDSPFGS